MKFTIAAVLVAIAVNVFAAPVEVVKRLSVDPAIASGETVWAKRISVDPAIASGETVWAKRISVDPANAYGESRWAKRLAVDPEIASGPTVWVRDAAEAKAKRVDVDGPLGSGIKQWL